MKTVTIRGCGSFTMLESNEEAKAAEAVVKMQPPTPATAMEGTETPPAVVQQRIHEEMKRRR